MKIRKLLPSSITSLLAFCLLILVFASSSKAAELEEIIRRGQLIVAVKDNLRPLGFYDERGKLQGLEIDIAKRLAKEILGSTDAVVLKPVTNQERLQVILDNQVDIVIARIATTPSRDRLVDFSDYYYLDGTGLVTKNPTLQKLDDLAASKIAVLKNSSTIAVVRSELPNARLIGVKSYQEALTLLEAGQADAFAADNSVLTGWIQEYPQYRQLPVRLSGDALCIAMPKGLQYSSLYDRINAAIARWQKSGWLRERATYWGLP
jgi:polar amino acid transport system substrate-binding protein